MPDDVDTVVCAPDDGWRYNPKHVEQFPEINKLCNVASCWIYIYIYIYIYISEYKFRYFHKIRKFIRKVWSVYILNIFEILFLNLVFLSPHAHISNRASHYYITLLESFLRMAMWRPKHVGSTS